MSCCGSGNFTNECQLNCSACTDSEVKGYVELKTVICQAIFFKRKVWRDRYSVLKDRQLYFFKNAKGKANDPETFVIDLRDVFKINVRSQIKSNQPNEKHSHDSHGMIVIKLLNKQKVTMRVRSEEELQFWVSHLTAAAEAAQSQADESTSSVGRKSEFGADDIDAKRRDMDQLVNWVRRFDQLLEVRERELCQDIEDGLPFSREVDECPTAIDSSSEHQRQECPSTTFETAGSEIENNFPVLVAAFPAPTPPPPPPPLPPPPPPIPSTPPPSWDELRTCLSQAFTAVEMSTKSGSKLVHDRSKPEHESDEIEPKHHQSMTDLIITVEKPPTVVVCSRRSSTAPRQRTSEYVRKIHQILHEQLNPCWAPVLLAARGTGQFPRYSSGQRKPINADTFTSPNVAKPPANG